VGDAEGLLPPPPGGEGKYDTVIQTVGLCSVAEPVKLLASAAGAVKPDTGRIILLEHGRGWWDWYNEWVVDRGAQRQFDRYGCWWNRDIELLVTEALKRVPGLELVALKRPFLSHFGTTLLIELKVNAMRLEGGRAKASEGKGDDGTLSIDKPQPKGSSWWPLSS
jgi:methyltransferase OMS1